MQCNCAAGYHLAGLACVADDCKSGASAVPGCVECDAATATTCKTCDAAQHLVINTGTNKCDCDAAGGWARPDATKACTCSVAGWHADGTACVRDACLPGGAACNTADYTKCAACDAAKNFVLNAAGKVRALAARGWGSLWGSCTEAAAQACGGLRVRMR